VEHGNGTTSPPPSPAPPTGTPDDDPAAALHWAAIATGLAEARAEQGNPLTDSERKVYDRFLTAAHRHGHTEQDIRAHLARLPRLSRITEPAPAPTEPTPRCPAAHPEDPTPCDGPPAVTITDAHGATLTGCEHHAARMLASLHGARVDPLPNGPDGAATRVFATARALRPYPWLTERGETR